MSQAQNEEWAIGGLLTLSPAPSRVIPGPSPFTNFGQQVRTPVPNGMSTASLHGTPMWTNGQFPFTPLARATPGPGGLGGSPFADLKHFLPTPLGSLGPLGDVRSPYIDILRGGVMGRELANNSSSSNRTLFQDEDESARAGDFPDAHQLPLGDGSGRRALTIQHGRIAKSKAIPMSASDLATATLNKSKGATAKKKKAAAGSSSLKKSSGGSPLKPAAKAKGSKLSKRANSLNSAVSSSSSLTTMSAASGGGPLRTAVAAAHVEQQARASASSSAVAASAVSPEAILGAPGKPPSNPCNCRKIACLKLYCDCFAARVVCNGCNCLMCKNTPEHEAERLAAIKSTLDRNPDAFNSKIEKTNHARGCHCKRSKCLKKYCECFTGSVFCGENCKCQECKNFDGSADLKKRRGTAGGGATQACVRVAPPQLAAVADEDTGAKNAMSPYSHASTEFAPSIGVPTPNLSSASSVVAKVEPAEAEDEEEQQQERQEQQVKHEHFMGSYGMEEQDETTTHTESTQPYSPAATPQRNAEFGHSNKRSLAATSNERAKVIHAGDKKRNCIRSSASFSEIAPSSSSSFSEIPSGMNEKLRNTASAASSD